MVPAKGGPKNFKLQSSWHRSKIFAVSLKDGRGRVQGGGGVPPLLLRCMAVLIHPWGGEGRGGGDQAVPQTQTHDRRVRGGEVSTGNASSPLGNPKAPKA